MFEMMLMMMISDSRTSLSSVSPYQNLHGDEYTNELKNDLLLYINYISVKKEKRLEDAQMCDKKSVNWEARKPEK